MSNVRSEMVPGLCEVKHAGSSLFMEKPAKGRLSRSENHMDSHTPLDPASHAGERQSLISAGRNDQVSQSLIDQATRLQNRLTAIDSYILIDQCPLQFGSPVGCRLPDGDGGRGHACPGLVKSAPIVGGNRVAASGRESRLSSFHRVQRTESPSRFSCKFPSKSCVARSSRLIPSTREGFWPSGRTSHV